MFFQQSLSANLIGTFELLDICFRKKLKGTQSFSVSDLIDKNSRPKHKRPNRRVENVISA